MSISLYFSRGGIAAISIIALIAPTSAGANNARHTDTKPRSIAVCPVAKATQVQCDAVLDTIPQKNATSPVSPIPVGLGPDEFHRAYNLPTKSIRKNVTIAIIGAYDNPTSKSDLDVYNQTFGLPYFPTCDSSHKLSCYQKVMQKSKLDTNTSWAIESALDVQTVHQVCQNCKLLLVEAATSGFEDMFWANAKAVSLGATIINNSWGQVESPQIREYDTLFNHPGVIFVASSGDSGYNSHYPAASQYVTAVGGTSLILDDSKNRLYESAWARGGSYCSQKEPKPFFQKDSGCTHRSVVDISADADDEVSGAAIYSSTGIKGVVGGWIKLGGTSLAAPLISGIFGLGAATPKRGNSLPYLHGNANNLHDIQIGANGTCITYSCQAGPGYDGPTGLGSPNGITAFQ